LKQRVVVIIVLLLFSPSLILAFDDDTTFGAKIDRGLIELNRIKEASGIAASQKNPGVLWTHNDSGGQPEIYAMRSDGKHLGVFQLEGAGLRDWEDIAVGPGSEDGESYIYIGDIGDNDGIWVEKYIYRLPEPVIDLNSEPIDTVLAVETITIVYPQNVKRDVETFMVDPLTRDWILISKREENVLVYRVPFPQSTSETVTAEELASLNFSAAVGGDISPDGKEVLIKTYDKVFYWCRTSGQTLQQMFTKPPVQLPYSFEPQGEAICWAQDAGGYFTTSEELFNIQAHVNFYPRLVTSVDDTQLTVGFELKQNYPNPFNSGTTIEFSLTQTMNVRLAVYDVIGREVTVVLERIMPAGTHRIPFEARSLPTGLYYYELETSGFSNKKEFRKFLLVK